MIARSTARIGLTALFSVGLFAAGCGSDDGDPGTPGGPDASSDAHVVSDAGRDSGTDAARDAGSDASSIDATTPNDAGADASETPDAAIDASPDAAIDASPDAAADASPDATVPEAHVSVLTQHNDIGRTGANLAEKILTPANVNKGQFGKLYCLPVDDEIYTQPLVAAGVNVPGVGVRDVLYVTTVSDTVYAFDANDGAAAPFWTKSFLGSNIVAPRNTDMTGACGGNYTDYSGNIGIVGTPVIDPQSSTIYFVARTRENGTYVQKLHALDIRDGSEHPNSPTTITATMPGTGDGATTITFDPQKQNQRASLLLQNGVVYVGWSSHCDWGPYHGWVMGFDAQTLQRVTTYVSTPDGYQGGIWMSGQGIASDSSGAIFITTGNGAVGANGNPSNPRNRSESILRLTRNGASLDVQSWFTPYDFRSLEARDLDLGSSGILLVPGSNALLSGSKGNKLFVADRTNLGGLSAQRNNDQIKQTIDLAPARNVHGAPVYWEGPQGPLVYAWAEYDHLRSYRFDPATMTLDPKPLAQSVNPAPDGMPGGMLSISANGTSDGILWAHLPLSGDANQAVVPGVVRAFDAANVANELWSSDQDAARDSSGKFGKFTSPTVANGKVYISTFSNAVCVYGLLPNVTTPAAPTGLTATAQSKTSIALAWADNANDETAYNVERQTGELGFVTIASLPANATTFTDVAATPFGAYKYRVRAAGTTAPSAYSNVASVVANAGAPEPRLRVLGDAIVDFGKAALGARSRVVTLENAGNAALHVNGNVTLGGTSPASFQITAQPPATIAAGAQATLTIAFNPGALGPYAATATIASDDPGQAQLVLPLTGSATTDLIAWWKFDEGAGQVATDASGWGNDGAGGGVTWSTGHTGSAVTFDGTSSVVVQDSAMLDSDGMTIAAWIKPVDWAGNRRIVQKGYYDDQYRLLAEGGVLVFDIDNVGTVTTALPAVNVWTHVAATYDHAAVRLYVNGVLAAQVAATKRMPENPDPLFIGTKYNGAVAGDHFKGSVDDLRIYSRALGAAEITPLAQ